MTPEYSFLLSGLALGFSSGITPGPLLSLTVTETMRHGAKAGLLVAVTPLITDGVLITLSAFILASIQQLHLFLGFIALAGTGFLIYLAYDSFTCRPQLELDHEDKPRTLRKSLLTNLLNPAPYLFWFTVGSPLILKANTMINGALFIAGFFSAIILSKAAVALLIARSRRFLQSEAYRWIMKVMGLVLLAFALFFFRDALAFLNQSSPLP